MARIIRKQSLWAQIRSYPLDLLLELNEQRELIDWDSYSETIALPLGAALTLLYFFIHLWQDHNVVKQPVSAHFDYTSDLLRDSKYFSANNEPSFLQRVTTTIQYVIFTVNVLNTSAFLFKTKTYTVFNKDSLPKTTSARKVGASSSTGLLSWIFKQNNDQSLGSQSYWELRMWNPSKFSTYLFISFPPFNIAFLYMSESSFTNLMFLCMTSVVLYFVIVRGYLVLIQDKQVIFQETFDEYERKYVRPKLSVPRREVAVDATRGPYGDEAAQYYSPGRTEKVFKTHDYSGKETVEKYAHGEFTPVKKPPLGLRKSIATYTPRNRANPSYQPSPLSRRSIR